MTRFRGRVLSVPRDRRGPGRRLHPHQSKGSGRRISTKRIAPEALPNRPVRTPGTWGKNTRATREQELRALKEQARAINARLRLLENRIRDIGRGSIPPVLTASVDPEMCVGCGTCLDVCPAGAVSMEKTARVDPERCTGCGICAGQCPRRAIALHPVSAGHEEPARVAL